MSSEPVPDHPIDPIVAELLRTRKAKGLRQQEIADKAGISRRSLVSIEAGGDCTLSTLRKLCAALECRPKDLLDYDFDPADLLAADEG